MTAERDVGRCLALVVLAATITASNASSLAAGAGKVRSPCELLTPTEVAQQYGGTFADGHAGRNPYSCDFDVTPPNGRYVETVLQRRRSATATFASVQRTAGATSVKGFPKRQAVFLPQNDTIWVKKGRIVGYVSAFLVELGESHVRPSAQLVHLARLVRKRL